MRTTRRRKTVYALLTLFAAVALVGPWQFGCGKKAGKTGAEAPNTPEAMQEMMKKGGGDQKIPEGKGGKGAAEDNGG